jgi:hypothetical protein
MQRRPGRRRRLSARAALMQIVGLLVAILLGIFLFAGRSGARPRLRATLGAPAGLAPSAPGSASASAGGASASASTSASPSSAAAATSTPPPLAPAASAAPSASAPDPIDFAMLGPAGGVPHQVEGAYRSPFANPKFGKAAEIRVAVLINDVRDYDIKLGTFTADFYLSLTSDRPMPDSQLIFTNGKEDSKVVLADRPTFKLFRYIAVFQSPPDLHSYPFDTQQLRIEIEESGAGLDQVRLVPDQRHTNLGIGAEVIGWDVATLAAFVTTHTYPDRFDGDDLYYSRYTLQLGVERYGTNAFFTVYVPAIVIVLISLTGVWITPDHMEVRANAGAPMLAAAVLFHFALIQSLPATPYLTRADKLMVAVYLCLLIQMLSTMVFFLVDEEKWDRVFRLGRAIVPPFSLAVLAAALLV